MSTIPKASLWLVVCCVLSLLAAPAAAAPSTTGSTGMIRIPTADVLRPAQFSAGYYFWQEHGVTVAAVGLPAGLEVSTAAPWESGRASQVWAVNAKLNLNHEALLFPAVAVGVEDFGYTGSRSVYGVMSKALPFGFRIHIGIGSGRFEGMFGSLEKVLNPTSLRKKATGFPVTSIIVEMDGAKMNYGARLRLARGLRLDAGWMGQTDRIYLGLSYTN